MEELDKLEWSALEYEEKDRGKDWFWALGVVMVASSIASILFENYFFATLIILGGVMLGFFAIKKPEMIPYEINNQGIKIKNNLYPFDSIQSFWINVGGEENQNQRPTLFIKSERFFMPVVSMPIESESEEIIRAIMLDRDIPEEEMREHISEKIMERLGF
ncbi:MAG: hypothetical protein Q8O46_04200 [bacterium]|nr:hypothetical protein [bacterium]